MQIRAKDIDNFLPEKKTQLIMTSAGETDSDLSIGFNQALDLISQKKLEVVISEDKLADVISNEWYEQLGKSINRGEACKLFSKAVTKAANTDKGLVTIKCVKWNTTRKKKCLK